MRGGDLGGRESAFIFLLTLASSPRSPLFISPLDSTVDSNLVFTRVISFAPIQVVAAFGRRVLSVASERQVWVGSILRRKHVEGISTGGCGAVRNKVADLHGGPRLEHQLA